MKKSKKQEQDLYKKGAHFADRQDNEHPKVGWYYYRAFIGDNSEQAAQALKVQPNMFPELMKVK